MCGSVPPVWGFSRLVADCWHFNRGRHIYARTRAAREKRPHMRVTDGTAVLSPTQGPRRVRRPEFRGWLGCTWAHRPTGCGVQHCWRRGDAGHLWDATQESAATGRRLLSCWTPGVTLTAKRRRLGTPAQQAIVQRVTATYTRYVTLPSVTFRYVTLRYVTLRYVALRCVAFRSVPFRYRVMLRYNTLHYITYITLHKYTIHYIT